MSGEPDVATTEATAGVLTPANPNAMADLMSPQVLKGNFWSMANMHIQRGDNNEITHIDDVLANRLEEMKHLNPQEAQMLRVGMGNQSTEFYVHNATIQLIEAAKAGMIPEMTSEALVVITELANTSISRTNAPYLAPAVDALLKDEAIFSKGDSPKTEFEETYAALVKTNPMAANILRGALRVVINRKLIVVEDFDKKFPSPSELKFAKAAEAAAPAVDTTQPQEPEQPKVARPQTEEERSVLGRAMKEYSDLLRDCGDKVEKYVLDGYLSIIRDKNRVLTDAERDQYQARMSLVGRVRNSNISSISPDDMTLLGQAGVSSGDVQRLQQMYSSIRAQQDAANLARFGDTEDTRRFRAGGGSIDWSDPDADLPAKFDRAAGSVGEDLKQAYVDTMHKFKAELGGFDENGVLQKGKRWDEFFIDVINPATGKVTWIFKDGKGSRSARKAFQKEFIDEPLYRYFQRIDSNVSTTYRDLFNAFTHGRYLELVMGQLNDLQRQLNDVQDVKQMALGDDATSERIKNSMRFMQSSINYGSAVQNYGQLFHDLPIFANDPSSLEKWTGFLAALPASQQAQFFDDPVIEVARSVMTRHLKTRLGLNGNEIPSEIMAGKNDQDSVIYSIPDIDELGDDLRRTFKERHERIQAARVKAGLPREDMKTADWEISRAITYSRAIGLLNLSDPENLGTGNIASHFRGIPDIIAQVVQRHKWNAGRGGTKNPILADLLSAVTVRVNPTEQSVFLKLLDGIFAKTGHDPKAIAELGDKVRNAMGRELNMDLVNIESTFLEMSNTMNIGSLYTRAGWRIEHLLGYHEGQPAQHLGHPGVMREMKALHLSWGGRHHWHQADWVKFHDVLSRQIGSNAIWWYAGQRNSESGKAGIYAEKYFEHLQKTGQIGKGVSFEQAFLGKDTFKPVDIQIWGKNGSGYSRERKTIFEIHEMQVNQSRGEMLGRLLRRSPGDYLLTVLQLAPELMDLNDPVKESRGVWGTVTKYIDAHGHEQEVKAPILGRRDELRNRFGEHGMERLSQIRTWINTVEDKYKGDPRFSSITNDVERRRKIMDFVITDLGSAFENLRQIDQRRLDPDSADGMEIDLKAEHIPVRNGDTKLRELMFGSSPTDRSAFMNIFTDGKGDSDFGDFDKLNEHNFNYILAKVWTDTNLDIIPTTADIDNYQVYEDIGAVGETALKRLIGDLPGWNEVAAKLQGLDLMIEHVARHGDLEQVYELCHEIFNLKNIVGEEHAKRAIFYVASTVATYMWETDAARMPFISNTPWGMALKAQLGDNISLSKVRFGPRAFTMDSNAVREFFKELSFDMGVLGIEGRWSYQHGKESFEATDSQWFLGEVMVQGFAYISLLIMYFYMKKALAEQSGH